LVAIDIFTRKGYAQPVKTKSPPFVLSALQNMKVLPLSITHDDGNEWKGVFKAFLAEKNIFESVIN
jgi:hypothetical protein